MAFKNNNKWEKKITRFAKRIAWKRIGKVLGSQIWKEGI